MFREVALRPCDISTQATPIGLFACMLAHLMLGNIGSVSRRVVTKPALERSFLSMPLLVQHHASFEARLVGAKSAFVHAQSSM